jgi:predicted glycosyltransferase
MVLEEKEMTPERLKKDVMLLYDTRSQFQKQMSNFKGIDGIAKIMDVLLTNL